MRWFNKLLLPKMIILFVCEMNTGGCQSTPDSASVSNGAKYFTNPQEAVEQISIMLREKNWNELAKYYNLTGSKIEQDELTSGEFFYSDERPEVAHPGGFWKYKHPFAPGFIFDNVKEEEGMQSIVEVTVSIEIDQGGGMIQRGEKTFLMQKSDNGYQILPPE